MSTLERLWPLFELRLRTERLELRIPTDEDLAELAVVAAAGVHPPEQMPFSTPWTDLPPGELERGVLQWHWGLRASWSPDDWHAEFAVILEGRVVGAQGIAAKQFGIARGVDTGSWLGQPFQGQGIGKEMRTAVLSLAFDGLGALEARSGAVAGNLASARVSRSLGYRDNGHAIHVVRDQRTVEHHFVMDRDGWAARRRPSVEIVGLEACRSLFRSHADPQ